MEILKPTWKKVIISFTVLAILAILSYFPISPLRTVYYSIPLGGMIGLLLISLIVGFYIGETNRWFKGILLALILLIIVTIASVYLVEKVYNPLFGYSCNKDSDCIVPTCYSIGVNKDYIVFKSYGIMDQCMGFQLGAICENNKCQVVNYNSITSVDFCDRLSDSERDICYQKFAFKLNDTSLCDKIGGISFSYPCYENLAKKLKDKIICNKILENTERARCVINVNKS